MIGLRICHLVAPCDQGLAAHAACSLIHWLGNHGHEVSVLTTGGERVAELVAAGITVIPFKPRGLAAFWRGRREVEKAVGRWNPDLIQVHHGAHLPLALKIAKALSLPVIASCDRLLDVEDARALHDPRIAWVIVPSEVHRAHAVTKLGLQRDRIAVLPCGVDPRHHTDTFQARNAELPRLGMVDHTGTGDGLDAFLEALAVLSRAGVPFTARIHSDGADAKTRLERSGLKQVDVVAWRPLAEVMPNLDVLVQPADHDQLTPAVLEAMANGLPVVAVAGGGVTDLVRDGDTGLLVPARDPAALAGALRELLADRTRLRSLGRQARALVSSHFLLDDVGTAAIELYRAAIAGCSSTTARADSATAFRRLTERRTGT